MLSLPRQVETIGDAYMVVGGVPVPVESHAQRVANFALGMRISAKEVMNPVTGEPIQVGIKRALHLRQNITQKHKVLVCPGQVWVILQRPQRMIYQKSSLLLLLLLSRKVPKKARPPQVPEEPMALEIFLGLKDNLLCDRMVLSTPICNV